MAGFLTHRGPDGEGFFVESSVGLAHRRLSIIDLETGAQPLFDESGELVLICNGEIYNFRLLREELEKAGHRFATNSDNEVILHLYEEFGFECVSRLEGMFAFALWDGRRKGLLLARDRLGIKPLYYAVRREGLFFGSEIKALFADKMFERKVSLPALDAMLSFNQVPGPDTLFEGVMKLLPGHFLWWAEGKVFGPTPYWSIPMQTHAEVPVPDEGTCASRVRALLEEAVASHMVSDVPVGVTLSGGLDSALVAALMTRIAGRPVTTFTIGFGDRRDERSVARRLAEELGTDHHEYLESYDELERISPEVLWHMEEPVPGVLAPTFLLARRIRGHVKVVLVGEGSDELFGGYARFHALTIPWRWLPDRVKTWAYQRGLNAFTSSQKTSLYTSGLKESLRNSNREENFFHEALSASGGDVLNKVLRFEQEQELPNFQLLRVDKMTMAHSVEARVPFLDHRLVEYVNSLPSHFKIRLWREKYLLRRACHGILPEYVLARRKQSFSYPLKEMFSGSFGEWVRGLLSPGIVRERGYYQVEAIERLFRQIGGRGLLSLPEGKLYTLAMIELWHRIFIDPPSLAPPSGGIPAARASTVPIND